MLDAILGSLLPVVVTFLLGFVAAWRSAFRRQDASILNRMVLTYALPLMLFVGTVSTPRVQLSQGVPLLITVGGTENRGKPGGKTDRVEKPGHFRIVFPKITLHDPTYGGDLWPRRIPLT